MHVFHRFIYMDEITLRCVALGGAVQLTRGIEKTVTALVEQLQSLSVEVRDEDLASVATVSAGGNEVVRARLPDPPQDCITRL